MERSAVAAQCAVVDAVRQFLTIHGLWGGKYLIAVSGGVDSVVLLKTLSVLRAEGALSLGVFHLNHLYRGDASDQDAQQVAKLAKALEIPCYSFRRPVATLANIYRRGFEEMGRRLRYQLMSTLQVAEGYQGVFTAHHADDQAETVLMHAFRGSGLKGLTGIAPISQGRLRPFLKLEKAMLEAAAQAWQLPICIDATNAEAQYRRNALRVEILPRIEAHFGNHVRRQLSEMAEALSEDEALLEHITLATLKEHGALSGRAMQLDDAALKGQPLGLRRRLVIALLQQLTGTTQDLTREGIDAVLCWYDHANAGDRHHYFGVHFEKRRKGLRLMRLADYQRLAPSGAQPLNMGVQAMPDWGIEWHIGYRKAAELSANHFLAPEFMVLPDDWSPEGLWVRGRLAGDVIALKGMQGRRSVKKLLSESDLASDQKQWLPMVTTGPESGSQVLWIPGLRKSQWHCERESCPERLLVLEYRPIQGRKPQ